MAGPARARPADDWPELLALQRRYADLGAGLADLSIVVLAARLGTTRILTFDRRDFAALRPLSGGPAFELAARVTEATLDGYS